jgi:hypothetical protein
MTGTTTNGVEVFETLAQWASLANLNYGHLSIDTGCDNGDKSTVFANLEKRGAVSGAKMFGVYVDVIPQFAQESAWLDGID